MERKLKRYRVTVTTAEGTAPTVQYVLTRWPLMRLVSDILKRKGDNAVRIDVDDTEGDNPDEVVWVSATYRHPATV